MREDWSFRWKSPGDRFRAVFDVFCQRWNICGMERGKPLLLKFTAKPDALMARRSLRRHIGASIQNAISSGRRSPNCIRRAESPTKDPS